MTKNILLVDNLPIELAYLKDTLAKLSSWLNFYTAGSAREGLKILKGNSIDLVFTRKELPGIDGLKLVAAIKNFRKYQHLRVYLCSEIITDDTIQMARLLGASGCIEKQTDKQVFEHHLKAILNPELLSGFVFFSKKQTIKLTDYITVPENNAQAPAGPDA